MGDSEHTYKYLKILAFNAPVTISNDTDSTQYIPSRSIQRGFGVIWIPWITMIELNGGWKEPITITRNSTVYRIELLPLDTQTDVNISDGDDYEIYPGIMGGFYRKKFSVYGHAAAWLMDGGYRGLNLSVRFGGSARVGEVLYLHRT